MSFFFRKDNPSQWLIASSTNTSSSPQIRQVSLLANFDLKPYVAEDSDVESNLEVVDRIHNGFIEQISSPLVRKIVERSLQAENGELDTRILRVRHLLRMLQVNQAQLLNDSIALEQFNTQQLFAENPVLDLITEHNIKLSLSSLLECLDASSKLYKELQGLILTDDAQVNVGLLKMIIHLHEKRLLNEHRTIIQSVLLSKAQTGIGWNDEQISLIPALLQKQYPAPLLQTILSNKAYYSCVNDLFELGLTQDIPEYFLKETKLKELELIAQIKSKSTRQLCLIFWIKDTCTNDDYQALIKAGKTYPFLAQTLIAMDKTGELSINELKALALNPQRHLQQSILSLFPMINVKLNELTVEELKKLNESLLILKEKKNTSSEEYNLVAKNTSFGQLLRIFVPALTSTVNSSYRDSLIDLLFQGVHQGPNTIDKSILAFTDSRLKSYATNLSNRIATAKQLQKLELDELIPLAAEHSENSKRFGRIISEVEAACKKINTCLDAGASAEQRKAWQDAEKEYRQLIYILAHRTINDPNYDYESLLEASQNRLLEIVDPEIKSWLHNALIYIANVFIYVLTGGRANKEHEKKTGNFYFFTHTESGNELRHLADDIKEELKGPK